MKIFVNDESKVDAAMMESFARAAEVCLLLECEDRGVETLNPRMAEISLSFVTMDEIHEMNKRYRDVDSPTDVLSFPLIDDLANMVPDGSGEIAPGDMEELALGDVVICLDKAASQAEEFGHSFERETLYLFTHSVLHLLGYDHMTDEDRSKMRAREEEVMTALNIKR